MAAYDPSRFSALIDVLAADIQRISAELSNATGLQAALDAEKAAHAADKAALDQAALDQANADLATSQASFADLEVKMKAQTDELAKLLPAAPAAA